MALFKAAPRDADGEPDLTWFAAQVGVDEAELRDLAVALPGECERGPRSPRPSGGNRLT